MIIHLFFYRWDVIIIAKSELFSALNDITFANKDPDTITREIITLYENSSGRTLSRADPVRLFLDAIILAVIQQRNIIDYAAKQNLLAYASGDALDHLGALLGVTRLQPAHAVCSVLFSLPQPLNYSVTIPAGTRLSVSSLTFAATHEGTIKAGDTSITLTAQCTSSGSQGNGFLPGQVRRLVDVLPFTVSAENITETNGGTDTESDEAFRERIQIAPESFSTAGPVKAYEYFARSADTDIIDVAVIGPPVTQPGHVNIYPLMTGGTLPSQEVIDRVYETCSTDNVRPDTDYLTVLSPETVNYSLNVHYWIDEQDSAGSSYIQALTEQAVNDWILWQRKSLGRDINPSELVAGIVNAGAKRCEVISPEFTALEKWQVAVCANQNVVYEGLEKA